MSDEEKAQYLADFKCRFRGTRFDMSDEDKAMAQHLADFKCPCGQHQALTSVVRYTDPPQFSTQCPHCRLKGWIGYTTLRRTEIKWVRA